MREMRCYLDHKTDRHRDRLIYRHFDAEPVRPATATRTIRWIPNHRIYGKCTRIMCSLHLIIRCRTRSLRMTEEWTTNRMDIIRGTTPRSKRRRIRTVTPKADRLRNGIWIIRSIQLRYIRSTHCRTGEGPQHSLLRRRLLHSNRLNISRYPLRCCRFHSINVQLVHVEFDSVSICFCVTIWVWTLLIWLIAISVVGHFNFLWWYPEIKFCELDPQAVPLP